MTIKQHKYLKSLKKRVLLGRLRYTASQHPVFGRKLFIKLGWNNGNA